MSISRRETFRILGAGAPAIWLAGKAQPATAAPAAPAAAGGGAFAGKHVVVPLPFDPKKLTGISERMITSHHDNNYAGAVKNLNKVEEQLGATGKDTPGFVVSGLKERELLFTNSLIYHEHYFGNLGGNGKISGPIEKRLASSYGSLARWEEHFRAVGNSLGGGSGWTILDLNFHTGELRTYWAGNRSRSRWRSARRCWRRWTCTSTPTRSITAPRPASTSTPSSRTSTGRRSTTASSAPRKRLRRCTRRRFGTLWGSEVNDRFGTL